MLKSVSFLFTWAKQTCFLTAPTLTTRPGTEASRSLRSENYSAMNTECSPSPLSNQHCSSPTLYASTDASLQPRKEPSLYLTKRAPSPETSRLQNRKETILIFVFPFGPQLAVAGGYSSSGPRGDSKCTKDQSWAS